MRSWFCTWLSWSSGSGFGSRGLRLCTLEIDNTTTSYSVFERRRYLRKSHNSDVIERMSVKLWWAMNGRGFGLLVFVALQETSIHPSWTGLRSNLYAAFRPVLTPACLGPVLLLLLLLLVVVVVDLTGMELGPFRGEARVLLLLATTDGLLREEVGVVAVWVFFMKRKNDNDSDWKTEEWFNKRKNDGK